MDQVIQSSFNLTSTSKLNKNILKYDLKTWEHKKGSDELAFKRETQRDEPCI